MNKPHAIIVALPLEGNVISSIQLAIKLASKGFSITFINLEHIHHEIITLTNPDAVVGGGLDFFVEARNSSGLDIDYTTVSDGLPLEFDRLSNLEQAIGATMHCLPAHLEVAVTKIMRTRPTTCCLIVDKNLGLTSKVARKFGLLYVLFCNEAAMVLNFCFHLRLLKENGHIGPGSSVRNDIIDYIPGIASIKRMDLISALHEESMTTMQHRYIDRVMDVARGADFILGNNVQELEPHSIEAIQAQTRYYAIGPLLPSSLTDSPAATSIRADQSDCIHWLDSKRPGSVLYVSFGKHAQISKEELEEIANGIKLSGAIFLWAVQSNMMSSDDPNPLPIGFMNEVADRGRIVSWTCQTEVLSHQAIGGFITHCGWNSTLQSIWCEVPLLCFPMTGDQFTNRKLIVDDWKIGCNLCEETPLTRDGVLLTIKDLLGPSIEYQLFNANIKEMKRVLEFTMTPNGFSEKNTDCFIKDLMDKSVKKNLG